MSLVPYQAKPMARPAALPAAGRFYSYRFSQPDSRAGTVYDRAERRRPHDRRQQDGAVYLDLRVNKSERRKDHRRRIYERGRREHPEPPLGIDIWA